MSERFKKEIVRILKFALVITIIFYVLKNAGGTKMLGMLGQVNLFWVGASLVSFFLSIVLGSFQWYLLLKIQGVAYSPWQSFKTYYSGMFVNAVVFNLAGDALRVYKLKRTEMDVIKSFAATFMDRFMGLFVLSVFSFVSVLLIWKSGTLSPKTINILLAFSLSVFLGFIFGATTLASRRMGRLFQLLLGVMGLKKLEDLYEKIRDCMLVYRDNWKEMVLVSCISCGVHSLRILGHAFTAPALGISLSLAYFFCFIPIISLATLIPLNVGGWGAPQGISAFLYGLDGVIRGISGQALTPETLQLAAGTLTFLPSIIFYLVMLLGGFFLISLFKKQESQSE